MSPKTMLLCAAVTFGLPALAQAAQTAPRTDLKQKVEATYHTQFAAHPAPSAERVDGPQASSRTLS